MVTNASKVYLVLVESLGDIIACEPIAKFIKDVHPDKQLTWVIREQYQEVIRYNPFIDDILMVDSLHQWHELKQTILGDDLEINLHFARRLCSVTQKYIHNTNDPQINDQNYYHYGSLLEVFCQIAGLPILTAEPNFHFATDINSPALPEHFIAIHPLSSEPSRDWTDEKWQSLIDHLTEQQIHVVELGQASVIESSNPYYLDLTHVHSIQAIAKIIEQATLFIGVDSAFAHLANALHIPSVILLGVYRDFDKYMPYTGYLSEHQKEFVIQYSAPSTEISVDEVVKRLRAISVDHDTPFAGRL